MWCVTIFNTFSMQVIENEWYGIMIVSRLCFILDILGYGGGGNSTERQRD